MVEITGADTFFTNIVASTAFTQTQWEGCIEQAIDKINEYARDDIIPQMTGAAGAKTLSVTSMQAGAIRNIAVAVYAKTKTAGATSKSTGISVLQTSQSTSTGGETDSIDELAKIAAENLKEIEVSYG